jgi:hypothetical protein
VAWEKRANNRYYYHSRRVGARVRKIYFGNGIAAALADMAVADEQAARVAKRAILRSERARLEPLDRVLCALDAGCRLLAAAELTAAGYHQHDRSAWRRRRGHRPT